MSAPQGGPHRLDLAFARARERGTAALVPFVTGGIPDRDATVPILHALVSAGADIIELGVPFSDPMADGPVIQRASDRAISGGTTLATLLDAVAGFRQTDPSTPIVLMGYLNSLEAMGPERFTQAAAAAGVDAVLLVDLPPEEDHDLVARLGAAGIRTIFLVAPTTSDARRRVICDSASGFVYYVSVKGTTGGASADAGDVARDVAALRRMTDLPVGIGFGIREPQMAATMAGIGDAVIIGSALVERIERHEGDAASLQAMIIDYIGSYRAAIDVAARA